MKKSIFISLFFVGLMLLNSTEVFSQVKFHLNIPVKPVKKYLGVKPPLKQRSGYTWISGHWKWAVYRNRYVWVAGYSKKNKSGHHWVVGTWMQTPHGWEWVDGHWNSNQPVHKPAHANIMEHKHPLSPVRVRPKKPGPNYVWVDGYFVWSAGTQGYVWNAGHWKVKKRGFKWVPGHYVWTTIGPIKIKVWVDGKWSRGY